jgi:hypothetical protein
MQRSVPIEAISFSDLEITTAQGKRLGFAMISGKGFCENCR